MKRKQWLISSKREDQKNQRGNKRKKQDIKREKETN